MAATIFAFIFTCLFVYFSTISFGALYFEPLTARNDSSTYKYVTVSNITSLNNIDDRYWTLHSWYYYSQSEVQQYPGIFSNRASGGAALFSGIFYGLVNSQDYSPFVQCGANFWGSYKSAYPNDTTIISMNDTWLHSVIVHENDTLSYYLNGKLYYNKSSNLIFEDSIISDKNSSTFYIGWDKWNPNQARWEGYLSDIAIFKRVLTENEIELLYNESPLLHNSILLNDNDLIHYWPLNKRYSSEDGQYVYDIISNSHGILGNTSMVDNHDPIIVSGLYDPDSWNTYEPSEIPSNEPTINPSMNPSIDPSMNPSNEPSIMPSDDPTRNPSLFPSMEPSNEPSIMPTAAAATTTRTTSQTTFETSKVTTMHATTTAAASTTAEQSSLISTTENENDQNNTGGGSSSGSSSSSSSSSSGSDITSTLIDVLIICAIICVIITTFGVLLTFVCWQRRSKNKFNKNHMALSLNENDTNNNDNNDKISRVNSTSAIVNTNDTNALIGDLSPSSVNTPNGENRQFPIVNDNNNNNKSDDEMLSIVNSIVNNDIEMGTVQHVLPQAPQIRQQPMNTLGLNMNNEANGEGEGGSGSAAADGNGNDIDDMYVTGGAGAGAGAGAGGMGVGMHDTNFVNNVTWENWDEEMFSKWMKNMLEQTEYGQFSNKMINNFMNSFNKIDLNGKILKLWVLQAKNGNQFGNIDINILLQKLQTKIDYNKESLVWDAIGQGILDLVQK